MGYCMPLFHFGRPRWDEPRQAVEVAWSFRMRQGRCYVPPSELAESSPIGAVRAVLSKRGRIEQVIERRVRAGIVDPDGTLTLRRVDIEPG
jgi:hypothetical protein